MADNPSVVFVSRDGSISTIAAEMDRAVSEITAGMVDGMNKATLAVVAEAKQRCEVDQGTLRESIANVIEVDADGTIHGYVGSNLDYAPYVHAGTGIYAKDGKGRQDVPWWFPADTLSAKARSRLLVVITKDGRELARTKGTKPNPFVSDAIDALKDKILGYFKGVLGHD